MRIALDVRDQDIDIWIWDTPKQTLSRFTFDPGLDENAVWTPDGKRIAYSSFRAGTAGVYWQAADGTGVAERLSPESTFSSPLGVQPRRPVARHSGYRPQDRGRSRHPHRRMASA